MGAPAAELKVGLMLVCASAPHGCDRHPTLQNCRSPGMDSFRLYSVIDVCDLTDCVCRKKSFGGHRLD
jgi:hypothetical protein